MAAPVSLLERLRACVVDAVADVLNDQYEHAHTRVSAQMASLRPCHRCVKHRLATFSSTQTRLVCGVPSAIGVVATAKFGSRKSRAWSSVSVTMCIGRWLGGVSEVLTFSSMNAALVESERYSVVTTRPMSHSSRPQSTSLPAGAEGPTAIVARVACAICAALASLASTRLAKDSYESEEFARADGQ